MLKHIVVIHDKIEARGGATALARLAALEYRKLGYEVTYITGSEDDGTLSPEGITTVSLGHKDLSTSSRLSSFASGLNNTDTYKQISDWIDQNDTPETAYHLHNWAQTLSPSVFRALRPVEHRSVMSCHDFFNVCPNGGLLNFQTGGPCELKPMSAACWMSQCDRRNSIHKYWRMTRQVQLKRFAKFSKSEMTFVCLHKGMEQLMRERGFNPPHLTSIQNPAIPFTTERVQAENNSSFLFIGRVTEEKGSDILLKEAKKAGVDLVMVGEGELAEKAGTQKDGVYWAGFCNRNEIVEYVKKARAIVVSGRFREPYGLVIAEAGGSGLPVIISQPSTLASQVAELEMGEVFDPMKPGELANTLNRWASDDKLIATFSKNAFDRTADISSTATGWAQAFTDIMEQKLESREAIT